MAQWPNLEPFPNDPNVGVWHMSDVPLAFGTYAGLSVGNNHTVTEDEELLSARLMDAWLTFAEVGALPR
jgi:carboxylesterase type B